MLHNTSNNFADKRIPVREMRKIRKDEKHVLRCTLTTRLQLTFHIACIFHNILPDVKTTNEIIKKPVALEDFVSAVKNVLDH